MNISDLPDFEDEWIGRAILTLMVFFMYVWITSGASPITFPGRANVAVLVGHLEVILVAVIPLALLGLIQTMRGGTKTRSTAFAQGLAVRAKTYRLKHTGRRYVRAGEQTSNKDKYERKPNS